MRVSKKMLIGMFFILGIIPVVTLLSGADFLFSSAFLIWSILFIYSINRLENRGMLFAFLISFFIFLIGRDLLQNFFLYRIEYFDPVVNEHAYFMIIISLVTIGMSYIFFSRHKLKEVNRSVVLENLHDKRLQNISIVFFYLTIIFAIGSKLVIAKYVTTNGYSDYYTDYSEYLTGNIILYTMSKIALAMPVAFSVFLATLPSKERLKKPLILYFIYLLVSLGTGQRSTTMLGLLFLMVYALIRQNLERDEVWFQKKYLLIGVIFTPVLAVFLAWYNAWRFDNLSNFEWYTGIFNFFYDQGVTSNVIKRAYMYQYQINSDVWYILEFLKSGIFARVLGFEIYHGNTVEHALYGGSYTHALGYAVLKDMYLAGRGTGTSYLAELYQDLGYFGIILGSILYSYMLSHITNFAKKKSIFIFSIQLIIINQLLWSPRGSFSGFLTDLTSPSTVSMLFFIFFTYYFLKTVDRRVKRGK